MALLLAQASTEVKAKCRGQGNLWEDPGQGQPWVGPPPMSAQAAISAVPNPRQPAHPPVAAAFNMDEELLMLEQQTKATC